MTGAVLLQRDCIVRGVKIQDREAALLRQRAEEDEFLPPAHIGVGEAVLLSDAAVTDKAVVAVAVKAEFLHQQLRHTVKAVHTALDASLAAVRPGLVAVEVQHVMLLKGKIEGRADVPQDGFPLASQAQGKARGAVFNLPAHPAALTACLTAAPGAGKLVGSQFDICKLHAFFSAFSSSMRERIIFSLYSRNRHAPIRQVTVATTAVAR